MVGRALNREVERDLQSILARCRNEGAEIIQRTELGMDRVVPALMAADRIGAARIARRRGQRIVAAFPVLPSDRMDRWKIKNVESHLTNIREAADHIQ
jgi:hypothetical protein